MMKQSLLTLLIVLLMSACSTGNKFKISGTIEDGAGKMLYIQKMDLNQTTTLDSVKLKKNGEFSFTGERLNEPTFLLLKITDQNYITLLADTTEHIEVMANATNLEESYRLTNSIGSAYIQIFNKRIRVLNSELDRVIKEFQALDANDKAGKKRLEDEYRQLILDHKTFVGEFIMENFTSFAGYYALFQRLNDNSQVMNVMDKSDQVYFSTLATSLENHYPDSERAKHLYNYVLGVKAQQQKEALTQKLLQEAKSGFPDIEEANTLGEKIKLSSLKGKTVLLSFWASWDQSSRKENNNLKSLYKKYHNKGFEIYQVSLDRSKILWQNAIETDELPWINVSDLRYTDSYPARLYNIQKIPSNYLISAEGEIVGKDLFGNRLSERLEEIY
ncbi:thioredoxin-like domain-containing protein [Carboxylicivirga caseinilyticus]|uniref:thioredoxin-like domain-containing protein n=1 Tax=Carboxylicivirga caseinilyticus TaxID=3417572 RepID=UPI003D34C779